MIWLATGWHRFKRNGFPRGGHTAKYWLVFWSLIFVSAFLYATKPTFFYPAQDSHYSNSSAGVYAKNKWSSVTPKGKGSFFIHSGEIEPPQLIIKPKKARFYKVELYIRDGSKHGNILFKTYKNDVLANESVVLANEGVTSFTVRLAKNDSLKILADKNGSTGQDWGAVKVYTLDYNEILLLIVALTFWLLSFIMAYQRNQAAYVVASFFVFFIYVLAERITFQKITPESVIGYSSILIALSIVFSFTYSLFKLPKSTAVLTGLPLILIAVSPLAFISYELSFGTPIAKEALFAIFQSNASEGVEFVFDFISFKAVFLFIVSLILVFSIIWWHRNSTIKRLNLSVWALILLCMLVITSNYKSNLKLPSLIKTSLKEYKAELDQFRALQEKRNVASDNIKAVKSHDGETYVIIIGESLNKNHMQVYGYPRKTTPKLQALYDSNELYKFTNTYSNHTHTMPVLSLALTEAAQDKKKNYYDSASFIEVFKAAGFKTTWLTNQNLLGAYDNLVSIIASQADKVISINSSVGRTTKTQRFDGDLIKPLTQQLSKKTKKNKVIVVHLMGNHGSYCSRFPNEYKQYTEGLDISVFGKSISENKPLKNIVNCYDNSVLYNDYVVGSIIDLVKKETNVSSVLYMADHADDVVARLGHNSAKFTDSMTQIPFLAWFSDGYINRYPDKVKNITSAQSTLFPNDRLYDTLMGWASIDTDHYRSEFDLTKSSYTISAKTAKTLHGRNDYTRSENHYYWQPINFNYLLENNIAEKFFPHRVNTTGKLKEAWEVGFRSFEVDVVFDYKKDGKFSVGHNHGVMGTDFETFLKSVDYKEINRMWFDFKNLNANNVNQALAELERLDDIFNLKSKLIVESGWTGEEFNIFVEAGWHTSYYLPTNLVIDTLKEDDKNKLDELAEVISAQVRLQRTSAVSFDTRLYPFVKNHLEAKLDENTVYHAWYGPKLYSTSMSKQIESSEMYNDPRIKTFLSPFKSAYNL